MYWFLEIILNKARIYNYIISCPTYAEDHYLKNTT